LIKKTFKSIKFKKLFLIPYGIWFLFTIIAMIPVPEETDPLTWDEFVVANIAVFILWFIISFIITYIVMLISNKMTNVEKNIIIQSENMQFETKDNIEIKQETDDTKSNKLKKLYTCDSIINATEYGKMAQYFPKMYWTYVLYGMILNLIFTTLFAISTKSLIITLIFCTEYQIISMIYYKYRLKIIAEKSFIRANKKAVFDTEFSTEFYEDFFIRKGKTVSRKINYEEIDIFIETNTNIYLSVENKNLIIIFQKNKCSEKLIEFLNNKISNQKKKINKKNNIKVFNKAPNNNIKIFMIILFIITILSLWGALYSCGLIGVISKNTYGFNMVKYMWIFWLWLPIPILSIILGFKYKKQGLKCTKNIVAGFIIGVLLLVYGSFSFIFKDFNDFTNSIFVITQDEHTDEINYYEINYKFNTREINEFDSEVEEIFNTRNCFDSFIKDGDVVNQLTLDSCKIEDQEKNLIEITDDFKNIIENVLVVQPNHDVFEIKILKIKNNYYVVVPINVNMWTPYYFYYYNSNTKQLEHIYTFSCKDVIGIKTKQ